MEINDYSELSEFITNELEKTSDFSHQSSTKMSMYLENELIKYAKLYSKPLYFKEQLKVKLDLALETQPHSKLWHFFHPLLSKKLKELEEPEESIQELPKDEETIEVIRGLVPVLKHEVAAVPIDTEDVEEE